MNNFKTKENIYKIYNYYMSKYNNIKNFNNIQKENFAGDILNIMNNVYNFKKNDIDNILVKVDSDFNGELEYERWVKCKSCDGTGKDISSKIIIKDLNGNITRTFDADDGCDFCDGTGKDYNDLDCSFCLGKGKVGINPCKKCKGEKRILGKQRLSCIKITDSELKIDAMGHHSKNEIGKVGYLLIKKIN